MRSLLIPDHRQTLLARFRKLRPEATARWGRMNAPRMLAHLSDQMRHTLGDATAAPVPGPLRWPVIRQAALYWIPWPRGRVKGPPEAFVSQPASWGADLAAFELLIERFVADEARAGWPEHAFFGPMTRPSWEYFCHRHFDYHLRQFGA